MMKKKIFYFALFGLGAVACGPVASTSTSGNGSTVVNSSGTNNAGSGTVTTPPAGNQDYMTTRWEVFEKHPMAAPLLTADELKAQKKYKKLSEALLEPAKVYRLEIRDRDEAFDFRKLSERIGELYNLQEMSILGIYSELPKEIGKLTQLQHVELSMSMLSKDFPREIGNWKNLKSFTLRKLSSAGAADQTDFKNLALLPALEDLTLDGDGLGVIPSTLDRIKTLKKLTIQFSSLKLLPQEIARIPNLEYLKLAGLKEITSIPSVGKQLKQLEIRNLDKLTDVSNTFGEATGLDKLEMMSCTTLSTFSENFTRMAKLRYLHLSDMPQLNALPSFKNLRNLEEVYLYNLPALKSFTEDFYAAEFLQKLTVNNCPNLTQLPAFERMPVLYSVDLAQVKGDSKCPKNYKSGKKTVNGIDYYTYISQISMRELFAKDEQLFYRYVQKLETATVEAALAFQTKNKALVRNIFMDLSASSEDTNRMVLEQLAQYTNLKELAINWDEKSRFPKVTVSQTVQKMSLAALTHDGAQVNWAAARDFINQFSDVRELETEALGGAFYDGQFTGFSRCTRMDISGIGQHLLAKNVSGFLSGATQLKELTMNVVTDYVPDEIYKINNLQKVDITVWEPRKGYQVIIPAAIGNLKQLQSFILYVNDATQALSSSVDPAINTLPKLQRLELTFGSNVNKSKSFVYPDGIQNLKALKTLLLVPVKAEPAGLSGLKLESKKVTLGK